MAESTLGMSPVIFGVLVFFIFLIPILVMIFMYRSYRQGQKRCEMLYPGSSLRALRAQEECKMKKRQTWAMPASAMLI